MGYYATGGGTLKVIQPIPSSLMAELTDIFDISEYPDEMDLYFDGKYHSDIDTLYEDVAPYVTGSLEFVGEDDAHWKIVFENGTYDEINGKLVYDSDPAMTLTKDQAVEFIHQLYRAAQEEGTDGKPSFNSAEPSETPPLRRISDVLKKWRVI